MPAIHKPDPDNPGYALCGEPMESVMGHEMEIAQPYWDCEKCGWKYAETCGHYQAGTCDLLDVLCAQENPFINCPIESKEREK